MDESPQFPFAAPAFSGDSREVEAGASFQWLHQAWAMFMVAPLIWVVMAAIFTMIGLMLLIVPFVGKLAVNLLLPVFGAGLLTACQRVADGGEPRIGDLFAAFQAKNVSDLLVVGLCYMGGMLIIVFVGALIGSGSLLGGLAMGHGLGLGFALGGFLVSFLVGIVLLVPLAMAMWFAPALVLFKQMPAKAAMQASFGACLRNWQALLIYGVITLILMFFAALPLGLGFLVLGPILVGTLYAAYRDIFVGA
jgi:uncharacterized membrane protein